MSYTGIIALVIFLYICASVTFLLFMFLVNSRVAGEACMGTGEA